MIYQDDGGEGQNVGSRILTQQLSEGLCAQHRVELCGCGRGQEMIPAIEKPLVLKEGIERVARRVGVTQNQSQQMQPRVRGGKGSTQRGG